MVLEHLQHGHQNKKAGHKESAPAIVLGMRRISVTIP